MTRLFLAIIFITSFHFTTTYNRNELLSILTNTETRRWFKNQTDNYSNSNSYCSICCMDITRNSTGKNCGLHTMCKFERKKFGPGCTGYISIEFTEMEKLAIVDAHNTLRSRVASGRERRGNPGPQSAAANMRLLQWDNELALLAETWASQCIFAHDICRDIEKYPVGQNIARGNFATNNDLSFIKYWYSFVEYFNNVEISNYNVYEDYGPVAQYTQLVWADTYELGCARVVFQKSHGAAVFYIEHFICNYGPTGNLPGQPVYRVGEPCSGCHEGTGCSIEYPGLCSNEFTPEIGRQLEKKPKKKVIEDTFDHTSIADSSFESPFTILFFLFIQFFRYNFVLF